VAQAGSITVDEGDVDTGTLGVRAAGNLLLQAGAANGNTTSDIVLNADVINTTGHTSLNASHDLLQNNDITAQGDTFTINLLAANAIDMRVGASIGSNNGQILLNAASGDVTVETITAGTAAVAVTAQLGSIIDRDAANDTTLDITAAGLILKAGNGIGFNGTTLNHLDVKVTTFTANAGVGGAYVNATELITAGTVSRGVTIDSLTVTVQRVGADAAVPGSLGHSHRHPGRLQRQRRWQVGLGKHG
jgi:hypothetical protein